MSTDFALEEIFYFLYYGVPRCQDAILSYFILGIKDDGTVFGLKDSEIQAILEYLGNAIYEGCTPPIIPHIYLFQ